MADFVVIRTWRGALPTPGASGVVTLREGTVLSESDYDIPRLLASGLRAVPVSDSLAILLEQGDRGAGDTLAAAVEDGGSGGGSTFADVDLYVHPVIGSDSNVGSQALPIRTLLEADRRKPLVIDHAFQVHQSSGTFPAPSRGWLWSKSILRNGFFRVFADEDFDPGVYTTVLTGVADVGTGQGVVVLVGGGLTPDALVGATLEMTSGAAEGYRQDIIENSTTDFVPSAGFDTANDVAVPAVGDSLRVFRADQTLLELPLGGPVGGGNYLLAQRMDNGDAGRRSIDGSAPGVFALEGFRLRTIDAAQTWDAFDIDGAFVAMYGVSADTSLSTIPLTVRSGELGLGRGAAGRFDATGLEVYRRCRGWGFRGEGSRPPVGAIGARIDGFMTQDNAVEENWTIGEGSDWRVRGGRLGRIRPAGTRTKIQIRGDTFSGQPRPLATLAPLSWFSQEFGASDGFFDFQFLEVRNMAEPVLVEGPGNVLKLMGDSQVEIARVTPGDTVIQIEAGAVLYLRGEPTTLTASTVGVPRTDWTIDGVAIDPLIDLANAGDVVVGVNGSLISRSPS